MRMRIQARLAGIARRSGTGRGRAGRGARRRAGELGRLDRPLARGPRHRGRRRTATSTSPIPRRRASPSSPATARSCAPGAARAAARRRSPGLSGVAVGPDGDVYATDATSVQRFSPRRRPSRPAGAAGAPAPAGCAARPASRSRPTGPSTSPTAGTAACRPSPPTATFLRVVAASRRPRHGDAGPRRPARRRASPPTARCSSPRTRRSSSRASRRAARSRPGPRPASSASPSRPTARCSRPTSTRTSCAARPSTARRSARLGAGTAPETQPGERLNRPAAVATDCRGAVYVADRSALRVHVFGDAGLAAPPCVDPAGSADPARAAGRGRGARPRAADPGRRHQRGLARADARRQRRRRAGLRQGARAEARRPRVQRAARAAPSCRSARPSTSRTASCAITFATAPEDVPTYGPTQTGEFWGGEFRFFQAASGLARRRDPHGRPARLRRSAARDLGEDEEQEEVQSSRFVWGKAQGPASAPPATTARRPCAAPTGTPRTAATGRSSAPARGVVDVKDFGRSAVVPVKAGQRYLARVPCASRRDFDIRLLVPAGQASPAATVPRERQARARARTARRPTRARRPARPAEAADPRADQAAPGERRDAARRPRVQDLHAAPQQRDAAAPVSRGAAGEAWRRRG